MSVQGTPPAKGPRRPLLIVLGACGALILIACVIGAAVAGFFYLRRNQAAAGQPTVAYILDTSPRMNEPAEGGTRLAIAQSVLSEIVRPASPDVSTDNPNSLIKRYAAFGFKERVPASSKMRQASRTGLVALGTWFVDNYEK